MGYVNNNSIYGMMNKNCEIIFDNNYCSFYKTKNRKKITVFNHTLNKKEEEKYDEVNYMYMEEKPNIKGSYRLTNVISYMDNNIFANLNRKTHRELFDTFRKFTNKGIRFTHYDSNNEKMKTQLFEMIEKWRYDSNGGMKYGWQEHAGIDKSFFQRYDLMSDECKRKFQVLIFYLNEELVGYSAIEREFVYVDNLPKFSYLIRKCLMEERNITEYIDYITFYSLWEELRNVNEGNFLVDWGASSGGVLWYKTHKWKAYNKKDVWFYKVKK